MKQYGQTVIQLANQNIVLVPAEVLVNAANTRLWMGGGVAGAIRSAAGQVVENECIRYGKVAMGDVVVTSAGRLPARFIFHAVVTDDEADLRGELASVEVALRNLIRKIEQHQVRSIVIPLLGAGVGGLKAEEVVLQIVKAFEAYGRRSSEPLQVTIAIKSPTEYARVKSAFDAYKDFEAETRHINKIAEDMIRQLEEKLKRTSGP